MDEDGLLEAPKSALPKPHSNPLKTQGIGGGGYLLVVAQCGIGHHHCLLVVAITDFFDVCFFLRCSLPFSLHCCLFVPRLPWLNERFPLAGGERCSAPPIVPDNLKHLRKKSQVSIELNT